MNKRVISSEGFARIAQENDNYDSSELVLYIDNTGSLYPQKQSIYKNLMSKMKKGNYDPTLAAKGFMYLVDEGAKLYAKEFGMGNWSAAWPKAVRMKAAEEMVSNFESSDEVAEMNDPEFYDQGAQEERLQQSQEQDEAMDAEQFSNEKLSNRRSAGMNPVAMWFSNDQSLYNTAIEMAGASQSAEEFIENLKDSIMELTGDVEVAGVTSGGVTGMFQDLLMNALREADWNTVADDFEEFIAVDRP